MVSFKLDIVDKFSARDVACMAQRGIYLNDYSYMADPAGDGRYADYANARHVLARLSGTETPRMPKNGPFWSSEDIQLLSDWIASGAKS